MKDIDKYIDRLMGTARFTDPYQKAIDAMGVMNDPFEKYQKAIDAMGVMNDPFEKYQKAIDAMGVMHEPFEKYQKAIDAMGITHDPFEKYQKAIDEMGVMHEPFEKYQKAIDAMGITHEPFEKYQKAIDAMGITHDPFEKQQNAISSLNSSVFQNFKDIALGANESIDVDSNGNVSLASTQILASELQSLADDIVTKSADKVAQTIENSVNNLINEIQNQKDPLIQKILIWFLYPIIVGTILAFVNPMAEKYIKSNVGQAKKEIAKELKNNVKTVIHDNDLLKVMKYVSADHLNVRVDASVKSEVIGQLKFSFVVVVLEKRKNWSLVQWKDSHSDTAIKGWVFSRYLKKFK